MFKENYYETIKNFIKKSDFGEPRDYGYSTSHAGDDYVSRRFKKQNIYILIDGVVVNFGQSEYAGNFVKLKHNFKFIDGVDDFFFSEYKHLDFILPIVQKNAFLSAGSEIGNMGNTGYSKTFDISLYPKTHNRDDCWRLLTDDEKNDPLCNRAVHTHIEFSQDELQNSSLRDTRLIDELYKLNLIKNYSPDEYFFRKGIIYINPKIIMNYAKLLLEETHV